MSALSDLLNSLDDNSKKHSLVKILNIKEITDLFNYTHITHDGLTIIFLALSKSENLKELSKLFFDKLLPNSLFRNEYEVAYAITQNHVTFWKNVVDTIYKIKLPPYLNTEIVNEILESDSYLNRALKIKIASVANLGWPNIQVWVPEKAPEPFKQLDDLSDIDWIVWVPKDYFNSEYGIPFWIERMDSFQKPVEFQLLDGTSVYFAGH